MTGDKGKGTSKLLTMKVADKLLSLMLVEESKFKRVIFKTYL